MFSFRQTRSVSSSAAAALADAVSVRINAAPMSAAADLAFMSFLSRLSAGQYVSPEVVDVLRLQGVAPGRHAIVLAVGNRIHKAGLVVMRKFAQIECRRAGRHHVDAVTMQALGAVERFSLAHLRRIVRGRLWRRRRGLPFSGKA